VRYASGIYRQPALRPLSTHTARTRGYCKHRHSLAAAGMGNKGVQIVDWREGGAVLLCHGEEHHGMSMCLDLPDLAQPVVLAGCGKNAHFPWHFSFNGNTVTQLYTHDLPCAHT